MEREPTISLPYRAKDLTGMVFSELTAMVPIGRGHEIIWRCRCSCGNIANCTSGNLNSGNSTSCGCIGNKKTSERNFVHGMSKHPMYQIWLAMRNRCNYKAGKNYHYYGGRGIGICKEWGIFPVFLEDMGPRPTPNHSLDRIDNDKGYSKENCQWATPIQQANNKQSSHLLSYKDKTMTLTQWARAIKMKPATLSMRIRRGWAVSRAIETGVR